MPWRLRVAAVGHCIDGQPEGGHRQRQIQEKDGTPRYRIDQPAAQHRPRRTRDGGPRGPGAYRLAAPFAFKHAANDRQAGRYQQGCAHALQGPHGNQRPRAGSQPAGCRGGGKEGNADDENRAPPKPVTERATHQQQGTQRQQVGTDDPLHGRQTGASAGGKFALDGGQGDVDDRAVDEGHGRAQHGGGQGVTFSRRERRRTGGLCLDDSLIAGSVRVGWHGKSRWR